MCAAAGTGSFVCATEQPRHKAMSKTNQGAQLKCERIMNTTGAVVLLLILLVAFSAARLLLCAWWIHTRSARMKRYDERWLK